MSQIYPCVNGWVDFESPTPIAVTGGTECWILFGAATINDPAGFTRYSWIRISEAEAFDEYTITGIDIHSGYQDAFASASDDIRVSSVSPSLPSDLNVTKPFDGDDPWLEISVYAN